MRISIIIPTYNEAKNLPLLVHEIMEKFDATLGELELVVVDDNSPDGTAQIADILAGQYPIRVIRRAGKYGLGSAVVTGFGAATGEVVGVMDADMSHDPSVLNTMVHALGMYDMVIGSRFLPDSQVDNWTWWRKLTSALGVSLAARLTGVSDPLSGYFMLHRSVIDGVQLSTTGYKILFEILIKGAFSRVAEVPFHFRERRFSSSKLSLHEYWLFMKQLFVYSWYRLQLRKKRGRVYDHYRPASYARITRS